MAVLPFHPAEAVAVVLKRIRARRLQRFLTQPFSVTQAFTGQAGRQVAVAQQQRGRQRCGVGRQRQCLVHAAGGLARRGVDAAAGRATFSVGNGSLVTLDVKDAR